MFQKRMIPCSGRSRYHRWRLSSKYRPMFLWSWMIALAWLNAGSGSTLPPPDPN
jgi:hypothetical protein